jgi:hypothetical protein
VTLSKTVTSHVWTSRCGGTTSSSASSRVEVLRDGHRQRQLPGQVRVPRPA